MAFSSFQPKQIHTPFPPNSTLHDKPLSFLSLLYIYHNILLLFQHQIHPISLINGSNLYLFIYFLLGFHLLPSNTISSTTTYVSIFVFLLRQLCEWAYLNLWYNYFGEDSIILTSNFFN